MGRGRWHKSNAQRERKAKAKAKDNMQGYEDNKRHAESHRVRISIPKVTPPSHCEHCKPQPSSDVLDDDNAFDENGYPITKKKPKRPDLAGDGQYDPISARLISQAAALGEMQPFRFLDLPPELRNRIYELCFTREKQPVCVPDDLLRPSDGLSEPANVLRSCYSDVICLPCQLHDKLGIATCGLSRVSQQLHQETAMMPYAVNTFSVHNLLYLQTLLQLIGNKGREHIKSLRFDWTVTDYDLRKHTNVLGTYMLLRGCKALESLNVIVDVLNLLKWGGDGHQRHFRLQCRGNIPHVDQVYALRGIKDAKIAWTEGEGMAEMAEWACSLIGCWRLPPGADGSNAKAVEASLHAEEDSKKRWVHWRA